VIQQALKDRGFDPGDLDGTLGPRTRAAIREFQRKEGLKVTGRLDAQTKAKLGIGAATVAGAEPRPGMEVKPAGGEPSASAATPAGGSSTTTPAGSQPLGTTAK